MGVRPEDRQSVVTLDGTVDTRMGYSGCHWRAARVLAAG
jgi:hypothetical protein